MHTSHALPPMDALAALLAAADSGSFTGAAETLGVTHGSVSRRIATLEAWIGVALFERHGRGVRLTPAGQRFAAETRQALGTLSRSAEQWRPWRGRQTVRLSLVPSFAKLWLLPRLAELERDDLHLDLLIEHRVSDLDARESDIAIRYGSGRWDGLDARLLFAETLKAVADRGSQERSVRRRQVGFCWNTRFCTTRTFGNGAPGLPKTACAIGRAGRIDASRITTWC